MNRFRILLFTLTVLIFAACKHSPNHQEKAGDAAQGYLVSPAKISEGSVEIVASLKDDLKKGELLLYMTIKNNSGKIISIDYTNCSLSIDAGRVVVPQLTKTFKDELAPGEKEDYEIYYYPINNVDFYLKTQYRGDMRQQYRLKLDFIKDGNRKLSNKNFTFKMPDTAYQTYMSHYGREKHFQIFDVDFEGQGFATKQTAYLTKVLPVKSQQAQHNVFAINPSVTINQIIINTHTYKYKDTLMIDMRMLNQDSRSIKILLGNSTIKASEQIYPLSNHFSDSFENGRLPDSAYIFKPGTRLHLLLKYYTPEKFDQYELNTDWILAQNKDAKKQNEEWLKFFYGNILFEESAITKDSVDTN